METTSWCKVMKSILEKNFNINVTETIMQITILCNVTGSIAWQKVHYNVIKLHHVVI